MATLVVRHPDGTEHEHEIAGELKIGRQQGNDLVLTEGGVSRQHARVYVEGGTVYVEDGGSQNGTFIDGQRIDGPTALMPGSQVLLGDYELKLKGGAKRSSGRRAAVDTVSDEEPPALADVPVRGTRAMPSIRAKATANGAAKPPGSALAKRPSRAMSAPAAAGSGPVLKGMTGPWAGKSYPISGVVLVGRAPPAVVMLDDDSVSRKHAEVAREGNVVRARDLGSANGTLLNGELLGQEFVELQAGDIIQFGVVEMAYETADTPARRPGAGVPVRRGGRGDPEAANGRRNMLVIAGGAMALLAVVAVVKVSGVAGGAKPPPPTQTAALDPGQQVQELLSECRSYASNEMGQPDWSRAEAACEKALDQDPINAEANTLVRRIKLEKEAFENFEFAKKSVELNREKEALVALRKIPKESEYFRRAKAKARESADRFVSRAKDDCKRYLGNSQWSAAVPRCQDYMEVWCQKQNREELSPPIGQTLKLEGGLRRNEWRPKDAMFVKFLVARLKLDRNAAPWTCPVSDILAVDESGPDQASEVRNMMNSRYSAKLMQAAMMDYWAGRGSEALATLQKLRSKVDSAQYHAQADELMRDVSNVDQLFKTGESALTREDPERAVAPFKEALTTDKRLMGELAETHLSFYRKNIFQDMAQAAYLRGKHFADREDRRRGCRIWKLGFDFYKGNTDLNRTVAFCSTQAQQVLSNASGCMDLAAVEDFAVPGDGIAELLAAKKAELKCR
ncbi:FHA domain-containing protein [Corallococcus praedator]|uniref:FHA domain-containing protein n=1 Tax=Corallococcus praedator TaxID=2316724 RepID=A0ABX9QA85_9BACT|nr:MULTISPECIES: FHA domain-containing protein [Corallococcus]RKH03816.1 FHA domain-containing protein [Corallococcus sp. CA047B]RKH21923.1 FHA domain-containing protein [Corallococcus sp. CA031C]RKH94267.1 FHA domain-containing protein [Corallococcus praedator]